MPTTAPDPVVVTVAPGARAEFEPGTDRPLVVDPGRTVRFEFARTGYNVVVIDQPSGADWGGSPGPPSRTFERGFAFEHTFDVPGRYRFASRQHRDFGMIGELYVGVTPSPTATRTRTAPSEPPATGDTVVVGPGGNLVFDPETLRVEPGTTVGFVWDSDGHNIVVDGQPEGADWQGTEGPPSRTFDVGHVHEHTFDVAGEYRYHCEPHATAGMTGRVVVE